MNPLFYLKHKAVSQNSVPEFGIHEKFSSTAILENVKTFLMMVVVLLIGCAAREFSFNQSEALPRSG